MSDLLSQPVIYFRTVSEALLQDREGSQKSVDDACGFCCASLQSAELAPKKAAYLTQDDDIVLDISGLRKRALRTLVCSLLIDKGEDKSITSSDPDILIDLLSSHGEIDLSLTMCLYYGIFPSKIARHLGEIYARSSAKDYKQDIHLSTLLCDVELGDSPTPGDIAFEIIKKTFDCDQSPWKDEERTVLILEALDAALCLLNFLEGSDLRKRTFDSMKQLIKLAEKYSPYDTCLSLFNRHCIRESYFLFDRLKHNIGDLRFKKINTCFKKLKDIISSGTDIVVDFRGETIRLSDLK
ncbi:hypothetical protein ADUPG1_013454 [Aduncisulcus paluster]|uniref:Uncharacterized protein n=1 Tax=Aduncisulcus paluster TaxID=2918883 RepID=A0ABQ5K2Y9_9EUKA|nr:hypothetical protein ADUPG1_013454 [Aduncisulcus paluster]